MTNLYTVDPASPLARLIAGAGEAWTRYTHHPFVAQLQAGTLAAGAFRYYLRQDYVFLIHFARAWALLAVKSEEVDDIRAAAAIVHALIDDELKLHIETCAGWGIDEAELQATPEDPANAAYSRFVLERGFAGDAADLMTALMPCVVGYAEIGARLAAEDATRRADNPFDAWIATYAGEEYQSAAAAARGQFDRVLSRRLGDPPTSRPRFAELARTFVTATRLEIGFWEMGLAAS